MAGAPVMRWRIVSLIIFIAFFFLSVFCWGADGERPTVNVLVVAIDGAEKGMEEWRLIIDYLQTALPQYEFNLIPIPPIELERIKALIADQRIGFVFPCLGTIF